MEKKHMVNIRHFSFEMLERRKSKINMYKEIQHRIKEEIKQAHGNYMIFKEIGEFETNEGMGKHLYSHYFRTIKNDRKRD